MVQLPSPTASPTGHSIQTHIDKLQDKLLTSGHISLHSRQCHGQHEVNMISLFEDSVGETKGWKTLKFNVVFTKWIFRQYVLAIPFSDSKDFVSAPHCQSDTKASPSGNGKRMISLAVFPLVSEQQEINCFSFP